MPLKRFRTRRLYTNTMLWSIMGGVLLFVSVVLLAMTGNRWFPIGALVLAVLGMGVAWSRDRADETLYLLDEEQLLLRRRPQEEGLPMEDLLDASLLDRVAARNYLAQRVRALSEAGGSKVEVKKARRAFMRFCTVDIGINTLSFGIGRRMVDRMPRAKDDLVLVRVRDGRERLLSPIYNQDLVDNIGRLLQQRSRPAKAR
ncbi:MAG: hypothetical protein QM724_11505 [Flavobacteriales bacterium]